MPEEVSIAAVDRSLSDFKSTTNRRLDDMKVEFGGLRSDFKELGDGVRADIRRLDFIPRQEMIIILAGLNEKLNVQSGRIDDVRKDVEDVNGRLSKYGWAIIFSVVLPALWIVLGMWLQSGGS